MRKVMIGTPCYDNSLELPFVLALMATADLCKAYGIELRLQFVIGNSLLHTARNEIVQQAIEQEVDDLIFIDGDEEWKPEDFLTILTHEEDIIGGVVVGKSDNVCFNAKVLPEGFIEREDGLVEVRGIGTGFMRISKRALKIMWEKSEPYIYEHKTGRAVFISNVRDGNMVGEDIGFCMDWRALGEKVFIDPKINISHIGKKKWQGDFYSYMGLINANMKARNDKSA